MNTFYTRLPRYNDIATHFYYLTVLFPSAQAEIIIKSAKVFHKQTHMKCGT